MKNKRFIKNKVVSPILLTLVVLFVSCLVISNILANQTLQVWYWSVDAGTLLFPITYVLSDVFSEVYGYRWSRRVAWMATAMNALFAVLVFISIKWPHPEWFDATHFNLALGSSFRIILASLASYLIGDYVNDNVFRAMRRNIPKNSMGGFRSRALVSSICGQIVDSSIFVVTAFLFTIPAEEIIPMIMVNVVAKIGYEIIILPATFRITRKVKNMEAEFKHFLQNSI